MELTFPYFFNFLSYISANCIFILQICGAGDRGCCITPDLDHAFINDWEKGKSYSFDGPDLGECNDFDLGEPTSINLNFLMEIYHTGKSCLLILTINMKTP